MKRRLTLTQNLTCSPPHCRELAKNAYGCMFCPLKPPNPWLPAFGSSPLSSLSFGCDRRINLNRRLMYFSPASALWNHASAPLQHVQRPVCCMLGSVFLPPPSVGFLDGFLHAHPRGIDSMLRLLQCRDVGLENPIGWPHGHEPLTR